jgi:4-carboxymuconolactone decarboxylase
MNDPSMATRYAAGREARRQILGDEYVERAEAAQNDWNADLLRLISEFCWGSVWTRDGLSRRDRSLITIAMLTALDRPNELRMHLPAAIRNGCTLEEIKETLLQAMVYVGVPAAVDAFRLGAEVLADEIAKGDGA